MSSHRSLMHKYLVLYNIRIRRDIALWFAKHYCGDTESQYISTAVYNKRHDTVEGDTLLFGV